jgi:hypothetical protein
MAMLLLVASMVLLSPNYVGYVLFAQVLFASGLSMMSERFTPAGRRWFRVALVGCLALLVVRAVGMSTWGVLCARDVSQRRAEATIREELEPLMNSTERVVVSSAFLYEAARLGLRDAIHSDWSRDRRIETPDADAQALKRLQPAKLVLTQFDFHRSYSRTVEQLRQHPEWVSVQVRDTAGIRTPDSMPAVQRIVQHISWAPVFVSLSWK